MRESLFESNFTGIFNDKRLDKRGNIVSSLVKKGQKCPIKSMTNNEAEQKGFYRFLMNEEVAEDKLIQELTQRCSSNVSGRHVLVIQDSTNFGLSKHRKHLKPNSGLGLVGNKKGLGFLGHCCLVMDSNDCTMLGFSDIHLWHREKDKSNNTTRIYKTQHIEEKESYRWIRSGLKSKKLLEQAKNITIIEDREGVIYEQFCILKDDKTDLLIRSRDNRRISNGTRLYDALSSEQLAGMHKIKVEGDKRKNIEERIATLEVRYTKVEIKKPNGKISKELPEQLEVFAVEAKEVGSTKEDAIKWRILTTHKVSCFEEAIETINKYKQRWYIEQAFRLLKKQGFKIEDTELTSGWAIRKLTILLLNSVLRTMQLLLAYKNKNSQPQDEVFNKEEQKCLNSLLIKLEQERTQVENKCDSKRLSWATWIIARLGGWKGNVKQRPPGPITLKRGLDRFDLIFEGWKIANQ